MSYYYPDPADQDPPWIDDIEDCEICDCPIEESYPSGYDGSLDWCSCWKACSECGANFTEQEESVTLGNHCGDTKTLCFPCMAAFYYEDQLLLKELKNTIKKIRRLINNVR